MTIIWLSKQCFLFFSYRETLPVIESDNEEDSGQFIEEIIEV